MVINVKNEAGTGREFGGKANGFPCIREGLAEEVTAEERSVWGLERHLGERRQGVEAGSQAVPAGPLQLSALERECGQHVGFYAAQQSH